MSERIVIRLDQEAYTQLTKQLGGIGVGQDTPPLQAGYMLGVQEVLRKLREGFVIG